MLSVPSGIVRNGDIYRKDDLNFLHAGGYKLVPAPDGVPAPPEPVRPDDEQAMLLAVETAHRRRLLGEQTRATRGVLKRSNALKMMYSGIV